MRFAFFLPALLLATGCGVPNVTFLQSGGRDAAHDAPFDAPDEAQAGDAETDAQAADAGDAGDAAEAGADYCKGDAGPPTTGGGPYKCCGTNGTVCAGPCSPTQCLSCEPCPWPSVCCTSGGMAKCLGPGSC